MSNPGHQVTSTTDKGLSIMGLMGLVTMPAHLSERVIAGQMRSADRLIAIRTVLVCIATLFVIGLFYHSISMPLLIVWSLFALATIAEPFRAWLSNRRRDYAGLTASTIRSNGFAFLMQGLIWSVPMIVMAPMTGPADAIALWTVTSCLMAAVAIGFHATPLAVLLFLAPVSLSSVTMMLQAGSGQLAAVVTTYALVLLTASLRHSAAFAGQIATSDALAESSEVVSMLLREDDASSTEWLWQTDASRRLVGVTPRLAGIFGVEPDAMNGKLLVEVLAGSGWESGQFDGALHLIAEKLKRREPFTDIVMPVELGDTIRYWEMSASPRFDDKGVFLGYRGVGSDVTAERESAARINQLARFDTLTGLANRLHLTEELMSMMERVRRDKRRCAMLIIDLDRFKAVNDTLGHQVGDKLLEKVAARLQRVCGPADLCARLGGDEFAVLMRDIADDHHIDRVANAIIDAVSRPYEVDHHRLFVGASVGSALAPRDGNTAETIIRSADLAMYKSKEDGGNRHFAYIPALHAHAEERRTLEVALREALVRDELSLVYQPVVEAETSLLRGFETLVRWTHPQMGPISPAKFIPVAEDARLIVPIGNWVLRNACMEAVRWPTEIVVAVNVSAEQLHDSDFVRTVMSALAHSGLAPNRLELEVTESVFVRESTSTMRIFDQLLKLGVHLSLDDFGTGYSSLGYLSRTSFSNIKIDRSFVVGAAKGERESLAIIRAVVAMARSLEMTTTAEGVESEAERELVLNLGCTKIQGYYYGRPMPASEARALFPRQPDQRRVTESYPTPRRASS